MKIEIEWLSDESDCDTCGTNWATGAIVKFEDRAPLEMFPVATCFGESSWDENEVYKKILEHLGHKVVDSGY